MSCSNQFAPFTNLQNAASEKTPQSSTISGSQLQLSWKANLGEQEGFNIEQSMDGVNFNQILQVADGINTAQVSVTAGQRYYFRIRSYNPAGSSPYSAIVLGSL